MSLLVSELSRVVRWADQERLLLDLLSFEVTAGGALGLTGPAGSGKSVVLRTLVGLDQKSSGLIQLDGVDADVLGRGKFRAEVGFASAAPLFGELSLNGWSTLAGRLKSQKARKLTSLDEVASDFEFRDSLFLTPAYSLSLPLARLASLVLHVRMAPRFLLADEPTLGLPRDSRRAVVAGLRAARARGMALILASRDERLLAELADDLILLYDGKEQARGRTGDIIPGAVQSVAEGRA